MKTQDKTIVLHVKIGKFKMIYNSCTRRSNMNAMQWWYCNASYSAYSPCKAIPFIENEFEVIKYSNIKTLQFLDEIVYYFEYVT